MRREAQQDHISKKRVIYEMPGMDAVMVRRDVAYRPADTKQAGRLRPQEGDLTMDIYYPPDSKGASRTPAVVFVSGYSDLGVQKILGCKAKEMGSAISWGQLTATSGLVAITYENRDPVADLDELLLYVRNNAESLRIDADKIGLSAGSGNAPMALSLLMQADRDYLKCAVLRYPITLDIDGSTHVADVAKMFGFVNPCAGKAVSDLQKGVPLLIARAGQDETPHLNEALDRFVAEALSCNLPITFVNHPDAPHAFDLADDSETSREIIRQILAFMRVHLLA